MSIQEELRIASRGVPERDVFHLRDLLPPHVGGLDEQIERRMQALAKQP